MLLAKIEEAGLAAISVDYLPVFQGEIDMQETIELHRDAFSELLEYTEAHVVQYAVELPNSTSRWVPVDFIKHLYKSDKNFYFRLSKFLKGLTSKHHRVVDEDVVQDLGLGDIGTTFLSLNMTLALMLHEMGHEGKQKKAPTKELALVHEQKEEMENLSEQAEASMALMLLQTGQPVQEEVQEEDRMLDPEEVEDEIPDIEVLTLNPIIVDGKEFLFLADISKSVGLREDEALSTIVNTSSMLDEGETFATPPTLAIDFEDHELTKSLEYVSYDAVRKQEENVAMALVAIQNAEVDHDLPDSAFQPISTWTSSKVETSSSFIIDTPTLTESDQAHAVRRILTLLLLCIFCFVY